MRVQFELKAWGEEGVIIGTVIALVWVANIRRFRLSIKIVDLYLDDSYYLKY